MLLVIRYVCYWVCVLCMGVCERVCGVLGVCLLLRVGACVQSACNVCMKSLSVCLYKK